MSEWIGQEAEVAFAQDLTETATALIDQGHTPDSAMTLTMLTCLGWMIAQGHVPAPPAGHLRELLKHAGALP